MSPVNIGAGRNASYGGPANVWTARSTFAFHTVAENRAASGSGLSYGRASTSTHLAQSFVTPATPGKISAIRVVVSRINTSTTDNITMDLLSSAGTTPSGTVLGTATEKPGSVIGTSYAWREFRFPTPIEVDANQKYWFRMGRSGVLDASNYFNMGVVSSLYPSGGYSTYNAGTTTWTTEHATTDLIFQVLYEAPTALYQVVQDEVGLKLHVYRSTDYGQTWSVQDAANAPSVTNGYYPFDATDTTTGPFIVTARMTATNTVGVRNFNMSTNTWDASDYGGTSPPSAVQNTRTIRVTSDNAAGNASGPGVVYVHFTDSADPSDLAYHRTTGSTWSSKTLFLSLSNAESSAIADVFVDRMSPGNVHRFYYDSTNDDFSFRSVSATTQSTQMDIDDTAATDDTKYASMVVQPYWNASETTSSIIPYINSNDQIYGRYMEFDTTSALAYMSGGWAISTDTGAAGRSMAYCHYDGTDYVFFSPSSTEIKYTTSTTLGTWSSDVSWKSGLTDALVVQALAIPNVGVLVVYTSAVSSTYEVRCEWVVGPTIPPSYLGVNDSPTLSVSESVSVAATNSVTDTNSFTITEAYAAVRGTTNTDTDTFTVGESFVRVTATTLSDSDTVTVSESAVLGSTTTVTDTDTITVSEAATSLGSFTVSDTDTLTVSEVFGVVTTIAQSLSDSDTLTVSETRSIAATLARTDADTFTVSESATIITGTTLSLSDSDVFSGSAAIAPVGAVGLTDVHALTVDDSVVEIITGSGIALTDSDTFTASEAHAVTVAIAEDDTDTLTGVESFAVVTGLSVELTDTVTLTSSPTIVLESALEVDSPVTILADEASATTTGTGTNLTDNDTLTGLDDMVLEAAMSLSDSDTFTVGESVSLITGYTLNLTDSGAFVSDTTLDLGSTALGTDTDTILVEEDFVVDLTNSIINVSLSDSGFLASTPSVSLAGVMSVLETVMLDGSEDGTHSGSLGLTDTDTYTGNGVFGPTASAMFLERTDGLLSVDSLSQVSDALFTDEILLTASELFTGITTTTLHLTDSVLFGGIETFSSAAHMDVDSTGIVFVSSDLMLLTQQYITGTGLLGVGEDFSKYDRLVFDRIAGMAQLTPPSTAPNIATIPTTPPITVSVTTHDHGLSVTRVTTETPIVLSTETTETPIALASEETAPVLALSKVTTDVV